MAFTVSTMLYIIAETAKANNLKPYDYFEYLLSEISKHMDDTDKSFLEDLHIPKKLGSSSIIRMNTEM